MVEEWIELHREELRENWDLCQRNESPKRIAPLNKDQKMYTEIPWRVTHVRPLIGKTLEVEFKDGAKGSIDLNDMIYSSDAGVFVALQNDDEFARVYIEHGAVTWPCGVDLAPDGMWAKITGKDPFAATP